MNNHISEPDTTLNPKPYGSNTNCYAIEGDKHWGDLHQWVMSNHISEPNITP